MYRSLQLSKEQSFGLLLCFLTLIIGFTETSYARDKSIEDEYEIRLQDIKDRYADFFLNKKRKKDFEDKRVGATKSYKQSKIDDYEKMKLARKRYIEKKKTIVHRDNSAAEKKYYDDQKKLRARQNKGRKHYIERKRKLQKITEDSRIISYEEELGLDRSEK